MNLDRLISGYNMLFNIVNHPVNGGRGIHDGFALKGAYKWTVWKRQGAVQFADKRESQWVKNLIVNNGKDQIMQTLGNKITAIYFKTLGIGDGVTAPAASDTDLVGTNKFYKDASATDTVYVRPNLILTIQLSYSDANFTWNEFVLQDNTGVTVSRTVDGSPLVKNNTMIAMLQYQISLP